MRYVELGATDISALCAKRGLNINRIYFRDAVFVMPTLEDIQQTIADSYVQAIESLGMTGTPEAQDCDDFSRFADFFVSLTHARNWSPNQHSNAIAFGIFDFRNPAMAHSINIAVTGNKPEDVHFLEPQITDTKWIEGIVGHPVHQPGGLLPFREVPLDLSNCEILKCEF